MAKFSRPTIQPIVKPSDLKKAIVEKNKKLGESVKILKDEIKSLKSEHKDAEKDLHNIKADCEETFGELKSVGDELFAVESKLKTAKGRFKETAEAESKAYSSTEVLKEVVSSLTSESKTLSAKVNQLNVQKNACKGLSKTVASFKKDIENSLSEIAELKTSKSRFKKQTDDAAKKCNEMIKKSHEVKESLETSTESLKAELKVIDKKLSIARVQCGKDISDLESSVVDKNLKLDEVDVMISKAESEYLSWEKKISVAKNNVMEEEDKIETVKNNFKEWQVGAVEEVARMKLKGRIENIDKAGLKDVLSR
tara:strand:- start:9124 stop:10053 length:930 start_codon:yes stop_codon:yes gene_type:complete